MGRAQVKHVILLIGDGDGYNCWRAGSMYQGRWDAAQQRSQQIYESSGWNVLACSTYPLNTVSKPSGKNVQDPKLIYDPVKAWSTAPDQETVTVGKETKQVGLPAGYKWLKARYTDSAAAATALSTGKKTYNAGINWSDLDEQLGPTASELAKACGKSVGIVTSVPWSHATPAGLSHAHVVHRDNYEEIAQQMLAGDVLDVIMGCGNPDYDDNGQPRKKKVFKYVGGEETWQAIEAARRQPEGLYQGFRPVSTKTEFEALLNAPETSPSLGYRAGRADSATGTPQGQGCQDRHGSQRCHGRGVASCSSRTGLHATLHRDGAVLEDDGARCVAGSRNQSPGNCS